MTFEKTALLYPFALKSLVQKLIEDHFLKPVDISESLGVLLCGHFSLVLCVVDHNLFASVQ